MKDKNKSIVGDIDDDTHLSSPTVSVILIALSVLFLGLIFWVFYGKVTNKDHLKGVVFPSQGTVGVNVPHSGSIRTLFIHKGDKVVAGQSLALVSIADAYSILSAPSDGVVLSYLPENADFQSFESIVNILSESTSDKVSSVIAFADFNTYRDLQKGQFVQVTPSNESRDRVGYVEGVVKYISPYPISQEEAVRTIQDVSIAGEIFPDQGAVFLVEIELERDYDNPDGLKWSFPLKEVIDMSVGTYCDIQVVVKSRSIYHYLLENVQEKRNALRLWQK